MGDRVGLKLGEGIRGWGWGRVRGWAVGDAEVDR